MTQPCALVLDEFDAGRADLLFVIQRASEGKGLMLTEDGGRIVTPHPLFRFCATANSRGQGDEHGIYAGVRPINGALLDRFPVFIEVDYLTEKEEGVVLKKNYPEVADETRTHLVQFAKSMRKAFTNGEITVPCSPRGLQSICEMIPFFDNILPTNAKAIEMAIETAVIDRAPIDNRQRIIEIADKHFPNCKFL
jgi:cobaltochelatase CobS